jgi:hypothetical protein
VTQDVENEKHAGILGVLKHVQEDIATTQEALRRADTPQEAIVQAIHWLELAAIEQVTQALIK